MKEVAAAMSAGPHGMEGILGGPKRPVSREDSQRSGAHLTLKRFLLVVLKKTLENIT